MTASESCSTPSSSSGDDFVPIFFLLRKVMKSLRRSCDKKRSTIRWMKQTQLQLKLSPVKTKAIQTWPCIRLLLAWGTRSDVSAESASRGIEDRTVSVVLIMLSAWRKFTVAVDLPLFARIFLQLLVLDSVERLFGHDKRPLSVPPPPPSNKWVETFCFSPLALLCPVDGSFIHHCLYIFYKFSQFRAAIEVAEQPPNKRRRNSSFLLNRWKLTPSFRRWSYLLQPKAQQKTGFSIAVQLGWLCHARNPLDRRAVQKPWNCQLAEKQTRRVDVFYMYQNLPHVRNSESRFTSTCLPRSRFLCDRRPTSVSRKLEICAARATNKVHIDEQPVGESKKRSLTSF